jgi:flavin-dependent dehydrogenase
MTQADTISCEVLVIGAGPTGLMAAYLLKRSGIDVRVIDKRAEPSTESRAG